MGWYDDNYSENNVDTDINDNDNDDNEKTIKKHGLLPRFIFAKAKKIIKLHADEDHHKTKNTFLMVQGQPTYKIASHLSVTFCIILLTARESNKYKEKHCLCRFGNGNNDCKNIRK